MSRSRLTDIAVALVLGILVAESPFTPDDVGPSIAIGAVVAMLFLWYRSTRPKQTLSDAAREATGDVLASLRGIPILVWLCLAVWIGLFASSLAWMYGRWTGSFWHNNHSLIVAVLMVLLTRATLLREARAGTPFDVSLWGLPFLAFGAFLAVLDAGLPNRQIAGIGFVISLPGMSLLLLGKRRTRALALPLAMSVFLIPLPSLIVNHLYLRSITAAWTLWLAQVIGLRASLYHSQIELSTIVFNVSEACSGFSTLMAAIALSLFLVSLAPSPRRRVAIVLAILPLTLAANTLRVLLLMLLSLALGREILDTMLHEASGVATFVVVIGSLFWIGGRPSIAQAFR